MSVKRKISPFDALRVFAMERRVERIQKHRKKLRLKINDLHGQISDLEDQDQAWSDREGDLESKIEHSGVFDD